MTANTNYPRNATIQAIRNFLDRIEQTPTDEVLGHDDNALVYMQSLICPTDAHGWLNLIAEFIGAQTVMMTRLEVSQAQADMTTPYRRVIQQRDAMMAALEQMVMEAEPGPGRRAMPEPSTVAMARTAIKDAKAGGAK